MLMLQIWLIKLPRSKEMEFLCDREGRQYGKSQHMNCVISKFKLGNEFVASFHI